MNSSVYSYVSGDEILVDILEKRKLNEKKNPRSPCRVLTVLSSEDKRLGVRRSLDVGSRDFHFVVPTWYQVFDHMRSRALGYVLNLIPPGNFTEELIFVGYRFVLWKYVHLVTITTVQVY